jgi:hypothetical protein
MAGVVVATCAYSLWLLPPSFGVRTAVVVSMVAAATVTVVVAARSCLRRPRSSWSVPTAILIGSAALLAGSAWASGTAVATGLGPFDSPYESSSIVYQSQIRPALERNTWPTINSRIANLSPFVSAEAIQGSALAGYLIMATGKEFLPIGGFSGQVPVPTLAQFIRYVREGRVVLVNVAVKPLTNNPDMRWVVAHCTRLTIRGSTYVSLATRFQQYVCRGYQAEGRGLG